MGEIADSMLDDMMADCAFGFPSYERDRDLRWCRYCHEGNLHWKETDASWRLFDQDGNLHDCRRQQPASVDDFEVVE